MIVIRAIQKIEIKGVVYWPGDIVEGLSESKIKKGIEQGTLAKKEQSKKKVKDE